ncbi:16S rRNA (guanine(527)-N(7))-methyltransferase RsmG [Buchananella felis]|uniref:16S rRNA (guanine(527)-N(7))-methyltransferase RsmG n=1 Tax=Buchananella felis TaxID=3231492 RepID=UPI0035291453
MSELEQLSGPARAFMGARAVPMEALAELLAREGEKRGLIGPRELPRLWSRHLLNSAAVAGVFPSGALVADVGSGAGFPGLVLAVLRPDVDVVLIEPMQRRVDWLGYAADELGLDNVSIARARAQELHGELLADAVTCRAVASFGELIAWVAPLLVDGGEFVALKGAKAQSELDEAVSAGLLNRFRLGGARVEEVDPVVDGEHIFEVPARLIRARRLA